MITEFTHGGKTIKIHRGPAPSWAFEYEGKGYSLLNLDIDPDYEFGDDVVAWYQFIMEDSGWFVYSSLLEDYVLASEQDDLEQEARNEARWEAEHIRQESRQDIFL